MTTLAPTRPASSTRARPAPYHILAILVGIGVSAVRVARAITPDADLATPALVAEGVARHGWAALRAWDYTQDNWLLTVLVPNILLGHLVPLTPYVIAAGGWLVFAAQCLFAALLVREIAGARVAAWTLALLLCATSAALGGQAGFLAHPVSHGVTAAFCLPASWLLARHLTRGGVWRLALAGALLYAAAVSDPWARAAFLLPLALAGAAAAVTAEPGHRPRAIACAAVPALVLAAGTHAFGLWPFLPGQRLDWGAATDIPARLAVFAHAVATFFPILPWRGDIVPLLDDVVLAGLVVTAAVQVLRAWRGLSAPAIFLLAWAALSLGATASAYAVGRFAPADFFARLFVNDYAALPVLAAALMRGPASRWLALPAASLAISLLVVQDIFDAPGPNASRALADTLARAGLSYGFGGYWSAEANAVTWITRGQVTLRPLQAAVSGLVFDPRRPQSFPWWYDPADVPPGTHRFFFVAAPDVDLCPDSGTCRDRAARAFGTPDTIIPSAEGDVLVWNHPPPDPPSGPVLPPPPTLAPVAAAGAIDFTDPASLDTLYAGWTAPGPRGTATLGARAVLRLPPMPTASQLCLDLFIVARRRHAPVLVVADAGAGPASLDIGPRLKTRCLDAPPGATTVVLSRAATEPLPLPSLDLRALRIAPR